MEIISANIINFSSSPSPLLLLSLRFFFLLHFRAHSFMFISMFLHFPFSCGFLEGNLCVCLECQIESECTFFCTFINLDYILIWIKSQIAWRTATETAHECNIIGKKNEHLRKHKSEKYLTNCENLSLESSSYSSVCKYEFIIAGCYKLCVFMWRFRCMYTVIFSFCYLPVRVRYILFYSFVW